MSPKGRIYNFDCFPLFLDNDILEAKKGEDIMYR